MKLLPDIIDKNLTILFVGFNPGLKSAETGHHYAGASNSFWKLLYESGITPVKLKPEEDRKLLSMGCGSVNIVARPTKSASEIKLWEYREGAAILMKTLEEYRPRIACYLGIGVYKVFSGKKTVETGLQSESAVPGTADYVCSSPSGLNRTPYNEQLQCFISLKEIKDRLYPD
jgi:TDG/mug DNA glycosylase family protein